MKETSSTEQLLREIEAVRAEMYRLAESSLNSDGVSSVLDVSARLDRLVYRFMKECEVSDRNNGPTQLREHD